MSTEQDRPGSTWGDEPEYDETETPGTFRDSYPDTVRQRRQPSHSHDTSQDRPPQTPPRPTTRALPRGVPGAAHIYEESDEPVTQDPRTTRQAHEEALARLRQHPRQSTYSSEPETPSTRSMPPAPKSGRVAPGRGQANEYSSQSMRPRHNDPGEYPSRSGQTRRGTSDDHPSQSTRLRRNDPDSYPSPSTRARPADPAAYSYSPPAGSRREQTDDYPYQQPVSRDPRSSIHERRRYREERSRGAYCEDEPYKGYHEEESYREFREEETRRRYREEHTHGGYQEEELYEDDDVYEASRKYRDRSMRVPRHHQHERRRRNGSCIIAGCLGALLTLVVIIAAGAFFLLHNTPIGQSIGKSAHTQQVSQSLALGNASELIVKNQVGNVLIKVDSTNNGRSATLTSVKTVYAGSASEADGLFRKIALSAQPISQGANPACTADSCLLITATLPTNTSNGGLLGGIGPSMDLMLTLPASFNSSNPLTPHIISANTVSGTLSVDGFNGILNLTGDGSKISVTHALIFAGTCLQTMQGDISVGTGSILDLTQSSPHVPCSNSSSSNPHPWFSFNSGKGNVDVTLSTPSTNLLLDANTNNGKINTDFGLNIPGTSDGSASYHGPLLPHSNPKASLYVFASTGNIAIHKG